MNILITGVTGFVGSHLVDFLLAQKGKDITIYGTKRWRSPYEAVKHLKDKITLLEMELTDPLSVRTVISESKPDIIFHLAAQSFIPAGVSQPTSTFEINTIGTLHILEAIRELKINPILHLASTADVYGESDKEGIVADENTVPFPPNLYSVTKLSAEMLGYQYAHSYGILFIASRILNHTGPGRGESFVESSFAKQIAEIEAGKKKPVIEVGNLDSVRTFMDVRDAVRAYWELVNKCKPGECYNIGGKTTLSIRQLLDKLLSFSSFKDKISVKVDPKRFRSSDSYRPVVKTTKFGKATGYKTSISFDTTLHDLLNYWRERV